MNRRTINPAILPSAKAVWLAGVLALAVLAMAGLDIMAAQSTEPQEGQDDTLLSVDLPHDPPAVKNNKFSFSVTFTTELPGKKFTAPYVSCGQSVSCRTTKTDSGRGFATAEYEATLPSDPPAAMEVTADLFLHSNTGDQLAKRASRIVDLGFRKYTLEPTIDIKEPLPGNSPRHLSFRFKDGPDPVTPVFPVLLKLSSDCADFSNSAHLDEHGKFGSTTTAQFKRNADVSEQIIIQPHFWKSETCEVEAVEVLQGSATTKEVGPLPVIFTVKPAYLPSFLMALAGAFCQYLIFSTARLIAEAQKQKPSDSSTHAGTSSPKDSGGKTIDELARFKSHFSPIFIGPAYSNVLSAFLKGILAFFVAGIMKDPNVFGITVEKGSFYGFFTLGVFFGFWPLEKLLQKLAEIAGLTTPQSEKKGSDDTLPAVSPSSPAA
jgi:hypothetical protein